MSPPRCAEDNTEEIDQSGFWEVSFVLRSVSSVVDIAFIVEWISL